MKRKLLLAFCALMIGWSNANAQETPTNGSGYYIYNADNDLFFTRGADWGTQAYASPIGIPWRVEVDGSGNYTLKMYDIYTQNTSADGNLGFNGSYTDNGSPIALTPTGNASDGFTLKNGDNYVTCPATKGVVTMTSTASKWKFLTQAQYEAVLANRASAQETAVATSKGIVIPGGNTLNGVVSDVNAWVSTTTADATPTKSAWPISGNAQRNGNYNEGGYGVEMFQTNNASITRTISGLAKGIYKVTVRGMKRMGTNEGSVSLETAGFYVSDAYMEANGNIIPVKSWAANNTAANVPDGPNAVVTIIGTGGYTSEGFVYVGDDGNLTMTLHNDAFWWGCWTVFNGVSYTFYNDEVSDDEATAILEQADDLLLEEMDATIKSNLSDARNTFDEARTIANYNALNTAIGPAQSSADAYALFAPERTKAIALGMDLATVNSYAPNVQNLMVAEYNYATENYATPIELGSWTETGTNTTPTTFSNEHWSGTTREYKNQFDDKGTSQGWWASSWSMGLNQDITLPAGDYVFKVAGRKSADATMTLTVTNKSTSAELGRVDDFPSGNSSRGINKSGATAFEGDNADFANGGNGYGWQWRYVPFSLDEETTVNIAVTAGTTKQYNWASFGDYAVWSKPNEAASRIAYNKAVEDAETAKTTYPQVTGTELTELNDALDADEGSTVETIDAATALIKTKTSALIAAAPSYDAYLLAKGYGEAINSTLLPYASTAKLTAVTEALETSVTSAATAVTATTAINTANRAAYESNMNAEGIAGAKNRTSLIKNADGNNTAGWSGSFVTRSGEPYTDASGSSTNTYFDTNGIKSFESSQTIKLVAGTYILSVTARAQAGIDSYKLKVTNNADELKEVNLTSMGNANGVFNRGWNVATVEFTQEAFGDATITIEADNKTSDATFWMSWDRFRLVSISEEGDYPVSITASGYATFSSEYPLDLTTANTPAGLEAYYVSSEGVNETYVSLTAINQTVAANEGILFKGTPGETYNIPVAASGTELSGNQLVATDGSAVAAENFVFAFVTADPLTTAGFYRLTEETTVPAGKAYLQKQTTGVKAMFLPFDGTATGVESPEAAEAEEEDGVIYNTSGQVVTKDYKGIVIKNGKKYYQK